MYGVSRSRIILCIFVIIFFNQNFFKKKKKFKKATDFIKSRVSNYYNLLLVIYILCTIQSTTIRKHQIILMPRCQSPFYFNPLKPLHSIIIIIIIILRLFIRSLAVFIDKPQLGSIVNTKLPTFPDISQRLISHTHLNQVSLPANILPSRWND